MYSRCHLIAGRFSRVRYRSATESTQSAGARSCSGSSFSLSFFLSLSLFRTYTHTFSVRLSSFRLSRTFCLLLLLHPPAPPSPAPPSTLYSSTASLTPARRRHRRRHRRRRSRRGLPILASLPRDVNIAGLVVTRRKQRSEKKGKRASEAAAAATRSRSTGLRTISRLFLLSRIFAGTTS